ncbi:saccharopine dehydrogenase NADP-binding domain-containing protein [Halostreptopolyspora alba]|uniref:NAD-dependent epimerase/dehydratase family protein n=1 Tax=Halostreptopolyspora alba TaxID=2487137 RepID=A0A3N0E599_9ACTN|nr:NAD-dependent epimerase/dehydratase family protein [Nocardiopsaceae bacterium YIM 96095]
MSAERESGTIGVLGGSGTVGRVAVNRLAEAGTGSLRVGARDVERARAAVREAGVAASRARVLGVDLRDPAQLAAFCSGCSVVVNCAGPSYQVLDTVARAALAAGADYVDAAGDTVAMRALSAEAPTELETRSAVFSAGLMPGLSGLLPRLLAEDGPLERLDTYVGGAAAIGPLSAVDALLTRGPGFGTALAAWRGGAVVPNALSPLRSVALPGFRGRVHAWPFLSAEAEELAATLGVDELRNYTVYVSERIPEALAGAWARDDVPIEEHVPSVVAAADADVAVGGPWYTLLFHARPRDRDRSGPTRLILRTPDSYALSGVVAALAARSLVEGGVPPGTHAAADVLDPRRTLDDLVADALVDEVDLG